MKQQPAAGVDGGYFDCEAAGLSFPGEADQQGGVGKGGAREERGASALATGHCALRLGRFAHNHVGAAELGVEESHHVARLSRFHPDEARRGDDDSLHGTRARALDGRPHAAAHQRRERDQADHRHRPSSAAQNKSRTTSTS